MIHANAGAAVIFHMIHGSAMLIAITEHSCTKFLFQNPSCSQKVLSFWTVHGLAGHFVSGPASHTSASWKSAKCIDLHFLMAHGECLAKTSIALCSTETILDFHMKIFCK